MGGWVHIYIFYVLLSIKIYTYSTTCFCKCFAYIKQRKIKGVLNILVFTINYTHICSPYSIRSSWYIFSKNTLSPCITNMHTVKHIKSYLKKCVYYMRKFLEHLLTRQSLIFHLLISSPQYSSGDWRIHKFSATSESEPKLLFDSWPPCTNFQAVQNNGEGININQSNYNPHGTITKQRTLIKPL